MQAVQTEGLLDAVVASDALLWPSRRSDKESAWHGHVSFAHWLVSTLRPDVIVELGSHNGVSYAAFCNAVTREGLTTKCYAVDTWLGDAHAGSYGEDVYQDFLAFNSSNFPGFSTLIRCLFDDALKTFEDGTVDILHIDGLHTFEAVKHDFESWLPKLSSRAVVLFHDTEVYTADFGVWRLWAMLSKRYPSFNFLHGAGLGVLMVGADRQPLLAKLSAAADMTAGNEIRSYFAQASHAAQRGYHPVSRPDTALDGDCRNVALHRPAFQSSVFSNGSPTAGQAVNGIKNGGYAFHTDLEVDPWWFVDLGFARQLNRVVIYNRLDANCIDRSKTLKVSISSNIVDWQSIYSHTGEAFGGVDGRPLQVDCQGLSARFVRLSLEGVEFLHLDQVEVFS